MAKVRIKKLTKTFGKVVAVDNLTLDIDDGAFVTLLGPSGCGKSTTLEIIAGLQDPTTGEVYIGDERVTDLSPRERNIAMVFQSYALYPHKSVYKNMSFGLELHGYSKEEIDKRVKKTAKLLNIKELLGRKPKELSGGQQQRVALGRAIVREPKVFLFDEPLSNLDAKLRLYMRAELKKLHEVLGTTTIYVTHDQAEAMSLADKIAVLKDGRLHQFDTPWSTYNHPADQFVAGFMGNPPMNFILGTCGKKDSRLIFTSEEITIDIPFPIADAIKRNSTSSRLTLGFRPEHISLHTKPDSGLIKSKVYAQEPMGMNLLLTLEIGKELIKAITPQLPKKARSGEVWISIPEDKMYFFDEKTGKNLV